ncbi:hypothetical protein CY34DRAFT_805762 [Suillus luteus UH-Slu-Lm8-n1]|uniref:Uncharacterized protein n=1 Tax=Suillus luteus UH-Slu-Lm8-n1 TaxID=930992 RepID=A0A0D0AIM0_9AGAM|nr:hypothetical protein CY34DRAFT_805762 [Suillus luteus UH-Slu-Lm8-n1]
MKSVFQECGSFWRIIKDVCLSYINTSVTLKAGRDTRVEQRILDSKEEASADAL